MAGRPRLLEQLGTDGLVAVAAGLFGAIVIVGRFLTVRALQAGDDAIVELPDT